ncbi:MAG TPA: response regulator transcription factor [Mycobacterium sp.]
MDIRSSPVLVALIDDYAVVLAGLARMLEPYAHRVKVAEIDANKPLATKVDIALFDSFAQSDTDDRIDVLVRSPFACHVVVYSWNLNPDLVAAVLARGVDGYLSKTLPARELVEALEKVHHGTKVVSDPPASASRGITALDWPGRREGLTDRESEILALITQGRSNADVARMTHLKPNTVKSYIRSLYRKVAVTSRTQAVLWGVRHGFTPDHRRIDQWRA